MATKTEKPMRSAASALQRFGFRQTIRGAIIVGLLTGLMMGAQGLAYAKAFPTQTSRDALVASLKTVPGANFFSGEVDDAARPDSYAIYKSIAMNTLIIGVWSLMVVTRLLRGFEENGQTEALEVGTLSKRRVGGHLLIGFAYSFAISTLIALGLIAALSSGPDVKLSFTGAVLMMSAVYLPGLFFGTLGMLTSQLAITRGRAITYGLVPLILLYIVRGTANSVSDADWMKKYTPFGWSDLLNPVLDPKITWIVPTIVFSMLFMGVGIYAMAKRDLSGALIRQSDAAHSRFHLLKSPLGFAMRRSGWSITWWGFGTIFFAAFFAAVANLGSNLAQDSPTFKQVFSTNTANDFRLAFLGAGTMFAAVILLIMVTILFAAVRREEAKLYLDNMLVQPVRRTTWLLGRLGIIIGSFTVISLLVGVTVWGIAKGEGIAVSLTTCLEGQISLVGIMFLVLGIGVCTYGFIPRFATAAMSIVIGWAFIFDILDMLFHLSDWMKKTSILTFIPSDPSKTPDWAAFAWLVAIGIILISIGGVRFAKRDIITE